MIQMIVITASVLLGMYLYPIVREAYVRFITGQYDRINGETDPAGKNKTAPFGKTDAKPGKTETKQDETPSIIGKSKFILSQSTPKPATETETEKRAEKEHIFAPGTTGEEPRPMEIEFPLEKVEAEQDDKSSRDDIRDDEDDSPLYVNGETYSAGGASFEELMQIKDAVEKTALPETEKRAAGKILYENQETELVEKLISGSQIINLKVSTLIKLHLDEHEKEQQVSDDEDDEVKVGDDEFEGFDFNQILS